jgi:hypothetical protein
MEGVIANRKDKKAVGPNGLYREHLKGSRGELLTIWTELFNGVWISTVLYKGKGDAYDANKYRDDIFGMYSIQSSHKDAN